jgi:hypothetical protein
VVERPNLDQLAGAMQGRGGEAPEQEEEGPATEVMSGDALSGMFGGKDPAAHDGTVEMQNPYSDAGNAGPPEEEFEVAATEVVSGDAVGGMFDSIQNKSGASQPEDSSTTVEASPPDLSKWQQSSQQPQQKASPQGRQEQSDQATPSAHQQGQQQRPSTPPNKPQQPPQQPQPSQQRQQPQTPSQSPSGGGRQAQSGPPAGASNDAIHEFTPDESQEPPAEPVAPAASAEEGGLSADYDGPWKLKTNFGLTYEFPDTSGLKNWLSNREELDGYKLAGDDGDFRPLDEWPQLGGGGGPSASQQVASYDQGGAPSSGPPSGARSPSSPPPSMTNNTPGSGSSQSIPTNTQPPSSATSPPKKKDSIPPGKKINPQEFRPPSQEAKWNKVLWVVFLVLALVATAIGLQTFDVYDVKGLILGESSEQKAQNTPPPTKEAAEQPDPAAVAESGDDEAEEQRQARLDKQIEQLLGDAKRALENNRLQTALDKLDRAKTLDPKRAKIFDMLATVYKEMGQTEDAESAEAQAKRLREQSLSKNEKGADGAEESEN